MRHDERDIQREVVEWWDASASAYGCDPSELYHVKNEQSWRGGASPGIRAGVPDLALDVSVGQYHGLRIELKTPTGRVSPVQLATHARLMSRGYLVAVCRSSADACNVIDRYLRGG